MVELSLEGMIDMKVAWQLRMGTRGMERLWDRLNCTLEGIRPATVEVGERNANSNSSTGSS